MTTPTPDRRTTTDLVVLAFTVTVCGVLLVVAVGMAVAGAIAPNTPLVGQYLNGLASATAVMLGALLGLLAGRRPAGSDRS
jgi:hypothetical protein